MTVKIDYKGMEAYIRANVRHTCGAMFGLEEFVTGLTDHGTYLILTNLCVDVDENGIYSILDYKVIYSDFIDDTSNQSLNTMLKSVIDEVVTTGALDI